MCVSRWLRVSEASSDVGGSFVCLRLYFGLLFSGMLCDILHSISLYNSYLLFLVFVCSDLPKMGTHHLLLGECLRIITMPLFRVSCVQICICKSHATAHPRSLRSLASGSRGRYNREPETSCGDTSVRRHPGPSLH